MPRQRQEKKKLQPPAAVTVTTGEPRHDIAASPDSQVIRYLRITARDCAANGTPTPTSHVYRFNIDCRAARRRYFIPFTAGCNIRMRACAHAAAAAYQALTPSVIASSAVRVS